MDSLVSLVDRGKQSPSAIAAFSNLVLSSPEMLQHDPTSTFSIARRVSPQSLPTGPQSLPTEIVQMIFQFVFESCNGTDDSLRSENTVLWLDDDPLSPSLFPYSLACVCLRWLRILRTIPIYWTRQVVILDAITTSLRAARTTLEWAGNRPLKVIVTRYFGTSETPTSERKSVSHVMQLLRPYIGAIWSLSFAVEHSCSIPALWRERGRARLLKVLTLTSRSGVNCASCLSRWCEGSHEYKGKLMVPLLQQVILSSCFFKNPLMAHPRLARWFKHITSLTIRGDATSDGNVVPLYKFLSVIDIFPSVRELTIEDVHFDDNAPYPSLVLLRPAVVRLRRITGRMALRSILIPARAERRAWNDITIIDCTVHGFLDSDSHFSSACLTITSADPSVKIEDIVCRWEGERLSVIGCPRVSRPFLECLHGATAPLCLSHLLIIDCDNVGAGDVVSLVKSRETQAASVSLMDVPDDDAFMALSELRVQGRGPPISVRRATWLAEHVDTFVWDTVARDGLRYVWDRTTWRLRMLPASNFTQLKTPSTIL